MASQLPILTRIRPETVALTAEQQAPGAAPAPEMLLADLQALVDELHPHMRGRVIVELDSQLDRDLGLDSLSRMEWLSRLERRYDASVPEHLVAEADTPRDVLRALRAASRNAPDLGAPVDAPVLPAGDSIAAPANTRTLVEALRWHAERHPDRVHVSLLDEHEAVRTLTYAGLLAGARRVAAGLQARGLEVGEAVAIMLPTQLEYLESFFGVLLAGGVPVPIYPPARRSQIEDHFRRHALILANARVRWLITFDRAKQLSRLLTSQVDGLQGVISVGDRGEADVPEREVTPREDDIAFLQYTSGSTGNPKGVVLTHRNVLASLGSMREALAVTPDDVFVSWLPLYHDMGLIGAWMGALYYGFPLVLMSPLAFLARPVRWLRAIQAYRATVSGGPNFAYELCLRRIDDEALEGLDLGSWRIAFNGAEPVSPHTLERFAGRFSAHGFDRRALMPVYGLAEATLGVAFTPVGRGPRYDRVERAAMQDERRARPAEPADSGALTFVSCGVPIPGFEVRAVDDAGRETSAREVGRLQFRGPSTTAGYLRNPQATQALFDDDWLDSGDLGYVAGGEIYISGRAKDVIIRAGRNLYPYELEEAVADVDGVRRGCVAVFGSGDATSGTERLVVLAETRESDPAKRDRMVAAIEATTVERLGSPPDEVVLAPPHTVLKTSSGKLRRSAIRDLFERGRLRPQARSVGAQLLRLSITSIAPQWRRACRRTGNLAWATYFWSMLALIAVPTWIAVALIRDVRAARVLVRGAGRALLRLAGLRVEVSGLARLPPHGAFILVSNHASYLDGLVLSAILPQVPAYVVKRELAGPAVSRWFLQGIGCVFVERFDRQRSAQDARAIGRTLDAGGSIGVFAEGTLHRMPGLLPFQLGAFAAAVEACVPVVPVVLRGTRSILRDKTWFPRRGSIRIHIGDAIAPGARAGKSSSSWEDAVKLRDATRAQILKHCGEPDLATRRPLQDLADAKAASAASQ